MTASMLATGHSEPGLATASGPSSLSARPGRRRTAVRAGGSRGTLDPPDDHVTAFRSRSGRPSDDRVPAAPRASREPRGDAWSRSTASTPDPGLFGPESLSWRVHHDPAAVLGGIRALFLQSLHPEVMLGFVRRHRHARRPVGAPRAHRVVRQRDHLRHRGRGGDRRRPGAQGARRAAPRPARLAAVGARRRRRLVAGRRTGARARPMTDAEADAFVEEQVIAATARSAATSTTCRAPSRSCADYMRAVRPRLEVTPEAREAVPRAAVAADGDAHRVAHAGPARVDDADRHRLRAAPPLVAPDVRAARAAHHRPVGVDLGAGAAQRADRPCPTRSVPTRTSPPRASAWASPRTAPPSWILPEPAPRCAGGSSAVSWMPDLAAGAAACADPASRAPRRQRRTPPRRPRIAAAIAASVDVSGREGWRRCGRRCRSPSPRRRSSRACAAPGWRSTR